MRLARDAIAIRRARFLFTLRFDFCEPSGGGRIPVTAQVLSGWSSIEAANGVDAGLDGRSRNRAKFDITRHPIQTGQRKMTGSTPKFHALDSSAPQWPDGSQRRTWMRNFTGLALAGCDKSLRSLLPLSYLPPARGRRLRKEANFYAGCYAHRATSRSLHPFFRTLLDGIS